MPNDEMYLTFPERHRINVRLKYEQSRQDDFEKYPELKRAWEEYRMIEKLYTGKG